MLLGATGSVGTNVLSVVSRFREEIEIEGVSSNENVASLSEIIKNFDVKQAVVLKSAKLAQLESSVSKGVKVMSGEEGLVEMVENSEADLVFLAMSGTASLFAALRAMELGKNLALANKELLVVAGDLVMEKAKFYGVEILPLDSEHSALFQCLQGVRNSSKEVKRLVLTASGGPFLHLPKEKFSEISVEQALNHPQWKMGKKISVDSATLFNKGLEVIEACWLFNLAVEKVDVIIHPQSRVHSLVEFVDGNILAHCCVSNMQIPIQYALFYPQRMNIPSHLSFDIKDLADLTFTEPRNEDFPSLFLARKAVKVGGSLPAVLNKANEVAVNAFLNGSLKFPQIFTLVEKMMNQHSPCFDCDFSKYVQISKEVGLASEKFIQKINE